MHMTLTAQCSNCAAWRTTAPGATSHATNEVNGFCTRGLYPDAGALLCQKYTASHAFQQQIISTMLKEEGPMAMPVKLVSGRKSVKKLTKGRR
jgi:hypothetical protein